MYKISTLDNGLTLITVPPDRVDSVTSLVAVGAGSRYETPQINGISHFLEHMAFKGTKEYPSAEIISTIVDSIGAINNAHTDQESTVFWIKSAANEIGLASDILSSMMTTPLLPTEEILKEKGVIIEEMKMIQDDPARYVWSLYNRLQFGDTPLGMDVIGTQESVLSTTREDFVRYMNNLYVPANMVLVYAGKLPENIIELAKRYFGAIKGKQEIRFTSFKKPNQSSPRVDIYYKDTDQAKLILGVEGYSRHDHRRYATRILNNILGNGMSSRLFIQVRERRGLAYYVGSAFDTLIDTGYLAVYAGLRLSDLEAGLKIILEELKKIASDKVTEEEIKKAKEMSRGRLSISMESTNFLAEYFAAEYLFDKKIETFEEYLENLDAVTKDEVLEVARDLFQSKKFNLQLIAPIKTKEPFEKMLLNF